jgi:hypothetical protein
MEEQQECEFGGGGYKDNTVLLPLWVSCAVRKLNLFQSNIISYPVCFNLKFSSANFASE